MTDQEIVSLLWCALAGAVLVGVIVSAIRMGLDEQAAIERRAEDSDPDPDVDPEAEARAVEEALARDWNKVMADCPFPEPLTAPRAADSPSAADLSTGQR